MAVTYTTIALVKKRAKGISTDLLDADIEENIYESENFLDALMKHSFKASFDAIKYGIVRQCCTDLTILICLGYDIGGSFLSLSDAEFTVNMISNSLERSLALLSDTRTTDYLKLL